MYPFLKSHYVSEYFLHADLLNHAGYDYWLVFRVLEFRNLKVFLLFDTFSP